MIADVAKTLAEKKGGIWRLKPPPALGKRSLFDSRHRHCPRRAKNAGGEYPNVALQDQIYSKDLPLLKKIFPILNSLPLLGVGATFARVIDGARQH